MKKWWMKGLAVALCAGMLAPAAAVSVPGIGMTVYAEEQTTPTPGRDNNDNKNNDVDPEAELQKAKGGAMNQL